MSLFKEEVDLTSGSTFLQIHIFYLPLALNLFLLDFQIEAEKEISWDNHFRIFGRGITMFRTMEATTRVLNGIPNKYEQFSNFFAQIFFFQEPFIQFIITLDIDARFGCFCLELSLRRMLIPVITGLWQKGVVARNQLQTTKSKEIFIGQKKISLSLVKART